MTNTATPILGALVTSPVGLLLLKASPNGLTHLQVHDLTQKDSHLVVQTSIKLNDHNSLEHTEMQSLAQQHINVTVEQLSQYFAGKLQHFSVSLAPKGTVFQREVWNALSQLAYGKHCSYSDIANFIGRPKAVRAVGAANGANPIAIIVPCHRVIGKGGQLTGYAYGLEMKQWLLDLEGMI